MMMQGKLDHAIAQRLILWCDRSEVGGRCCETRVPSRHGLAQHFCRALYDGEYGFDTGVVVTGGGEFQLLESKELFDRVEFRIDNVLVHTRRGSRLHPLDEVRYLSVQIITNATFTRSLDVDLLEVYAYDTDAKASAAALGARIDPTVL